MLPKTSIKSYDEQTRWMYFLIEDGDLSESDTKPVYNTIF